MKKNITRKRKIIKNKKNYKRSKKIKRGVNKIIGGQHNTTFYSTFQSNNSPSHYETPVPVGNGHYYSTITPFPTKSKITSNPIYSEINSNPIYSKITSNPDNTYNYIDVNPETENTTTPPMLLNLKIKTRQNNTTAHISSLNGNVSVYNYSPNISGLVFTK